MRLYRQTLIRISDLDVNGNINYNTAPYTPINHSDFELFKLEENDFLFPRTGSIGLLGIVKYKIDAVFASYLIRFRFTKHFNTNYLKYYFISDCFIHGILSDLHGGVNQNIHAENIKNQSIAFSSLSEQTQIAKYLDKKTTKIDQTTAQKEKLIELYEEEKKAMINQAVTKGIRGVSGAEAPKLKPSGIEWLGDIPKHWEVVKIKFVINFFDNLRIPLSADERGEMTEKKYDYYGASGIIDKVNDYLFDGEYILLGEDGANLLTRSTNLAFKATGKFWVNNHAHILKPVENNNIDYYTHLLELNDYKIYVTGSAQPKLTQEKLANIDVLKPPVKEQTEIVRHIEEQSERINKAITKAKKEIELLKEYRQALIFEAVTGKIDVREEAV